MIKFSIIAIVLVNVFVCVAANPVIRSCEIRKNDPTILDVTYIVHSQNQTVNVRALAFKDGERSFEKVVRPETFVNDASGKETSQNIGDNIPANVEHTLSWKVSADWTTDLAKVKFEILISEQGVLPLDLITIPAVNGNPEITISYNSQTSANVFNALLWYYANGEKDLRLVDGYLYKTNGDLLSNRKTPANMVFAVSYIFTKMGYKGMDGEILSFARLATRKNLAFNTKIHHCCKKSGLSGSLYIDEKAYCVIDISGGTSASSYPISYIDSCPLAGWGYEYKTTKILLRRIEPGNVLLGGIKPVTLTKPFYMGVFEITQRQYQLVTGLTPSHYKKDAHPVEYVSWSDVRGDYKVYDWPNSTSVEPTSFIGKLQLKTGLNFDLPTEAQWEYACRAGTSTAYNNGGTTGDDLRYICRNRNNCEDGRGDYYSVHAVVGSYSPNAFGLYDMHGNVSEMCLDWFSGINSDPKVDWVGASSGSYRIQRGGGWDNWGSDALSSSFRDSFFPSYTSFERGFRLSRTLVE